MSHSPLSIFTVAVLRAGLCFSAHWLALLWGDHSGMLVGFQPESHSTPPWPALKVLVSGELLHPPPLESLGYRQGHSTPRVHSRPGLEKGGLVGRNSQMGITIGGAQGRTWEELLVSGRVKSDGVPKSGRKGK